ncbi:MAG: pilus assembly PilX N-terminal domain-containing protein [Candidatus Omnitrophica bacterium]|nr:pilus assembly PilX N-terminal domain-containing protein [Candidatus Omnitrophota bacterium]
MYAGYFLRSCRRAPGNRGAALIILFLVMAVLSVLFTSFVSRSVYDRRATQRVYDGMQAGYLAEAGIDQVKRDLYDLFETYFMTNGRVAAAFSWFDDLTNAAALATKYPAIPTNATLPNIPNGQFTVQISSVDTSLSVPKDVTVLSTGTCNGISRTYRAVLRYSMCPSRVFDYSYFVNNFGWFSGGGITSNGDIRSNGNFDFGGNPKVNGDVFASVNPALGAAGTITGNSKKDTIAYYRNHAPDQARPTNPAADPQDIDGDSLVEEFPYADGYDGTSDRNPAQQLLDLPYLGDLQYYKNLAASYSGRISQAGAPLITNVHNGNIVLIGTDADPIEINGPVVVTGDVLIKGKVKGQGTIYAGRNVHVIADVTYVDPPVWPKPDTDPAGTDTRNNTKDFLGLAAKGNVIIGDYTRNDWKTNVGNYLKPPFTQAYEVDPTDNGIGYVTQYSGGKPYFNGNYTANDGGTKADGSSRKYYESSYTDAYVQSIAVSASSIREVNAVVFTNHAFAGKVGAFTWNGSIVSRDEALVYSGSIDINYDVRTKDKGGTQHDFFLPRELAPPHSQFVERN